MTRTALDLLDTIREHLTAFDLPPLCSVTVAASSLAPQVSAQLGCHEPPRVAAGLLAWADTLTEPTAEAWRVPSGHELHLSVTGQLPGGATVRVYAGMAFPERELGAGLAPGDRTPALLGALRHLATFGEVPA